MDCRQAFLTFIFLMVIMSFLLEKQKQINKWQVEEIHFVGFLSKLLETKLMHVLRFKHGQVSMHASLSFL